MAPSGQIPHGAGYPSQQAVPVSGFQVNPVVPMKRPRPREDSINMSPRQQNMPLPPSRSQTPSQSQAMGYQMYPNGQVNQQRQFTPGFAPQHLQQHPGSSNASPSPVLSNQTFQNGATAGKRVATQSPSPFLQTSFNMGGQGSPTSEQHLSRAGTPLNSANSPAASSAGGSFPPVTSSVPPNSQAMYQQFQPAPSQQLNAAQLHQKRMFQQQQQQLQNQAMMGARPPPDASQIPNGAIGQQGNPMRPGAPMPSKQNDPNGFLASLKEFMAKNGSPIPGAPMINNQPVNLMQMHSVIMKNGGSHRISSSGMWPQVAMSLGYPQELAQEMMNIHGRYLALFERHWLARQQQQRQQQQQAHIKQGVPMPQPPSTPQKPNMPDNRAPTPSQSAQSPISAQAPPQTPVKDSPMSANFPNRAPNGFVTPQRTGQTPRQGTPLSHAGTPQPTIQQSPVNANFPQNAVPRVSQQDLLNSTLQASPTIPPQPKGRTFKPKVRQLDTHGGINVGVLSELNYYKPTAPTFTELGVIDIHALNMALKSGIPAEIRVALDNLVTISVVPGTTLQLDLCEDLVDSLLDVADMLTELLAEHTESTSDAVIVPSYEDVLRASKFEGDGLVSVPKFGTLDYELDKAAEKVICITTIFRNLSFFETNHPILSGPDVVKFISRTIELLGSKKLFLRTHQNTLDFMKDIIIYLSNLAQAIEIPGIDEAANLLHVILAFAPTPSPSASGRDKLMFIPYQPSVHRYLPPAVDSFAKLLARDEPNRSHYKTLFLSEPHTVPKYDLLTRSFALAISPIPDHSKPHVVLAPMSEARKPILEQGLLAAEILAGIAPGTDQGIAHEWLQSEDGFAANLLRLIVCLLSAHARPPPPQHRGPQNQDDTQPFARITHRGMTVLQRLLDKCDPDFLRHHLPVGVMPKKENLLGALLTQQIEPVIIKQLCAYAGYDDV
ncbi:hypothetical protein BJ508DRAFT_209916 [Ascobolus immersus RN42]|uniref:ARID domain-containing protein n=1 Tax=Ascobolus immersus RN42 TaxID=1160509 RepID=A0A3N4IGH5_ASCIM|nr:hypothetical protein BJ508DRAFT_209916 [Ascobolus immersus RN42]